MSESSIEWTHRPRPDGSLMPGYTLNAWWGCTPADGHGGDAQSPACDNCYAAAWADKCGRTGLWAELGPRRHGSEHTLNDPIRWNRLAEQLGEQHAVFCGSMCDIGEDRRDLDGLRGRVWSLIAQTPHLLWLLLTKRPAALRRLVPWRGAWPSNVWFGTTVETPAYLWRAQEALLADAPVHFISHEPALADVDFTSVLGSKRGTVRWLIIGSESGASARPVPLGRVEGAVAQALALGAAPYVKQLDASLLQLGRRGKAIKDLAHFPPHLRVRAWPLLETR